MLVIAVSEKLDGLISRIKNACGFHLLKVGPSSWTVNPVVLADSCSFEICFFGPVSLMMFVTYRCRIEIVLYYVTQ